MKKPLCCSDGREHRGRYQQMLLEKSKKLMPFLKCHLHYNVCQWNSKRECLCGALFRENGGMVAVVVFTPQK